MNQKSKSLNINIILTAIKTIVSLMFPIITFPYITRVLSPAGIGEYNYANSLVSYFTLIASLGISTYAIREGSKIRNKKVEFSIFANEVFSLNIICTVIAYIMLFVCVLLIDEFKAHQLAILICSISIIFKTIGVDWVFSIYEDYLYITIRSLGFQVISVICLFLFVRTEEDVYKYIFINIVSSIGSNIFNYFYAKKYFKIKLTFNMNLVKHILPSVLIFSTTLATMIYINSDTTMLGWICGTEEVGYYTVSCKMYNIIKSTLNAIVPVFMARLSFQLQNDKVQYKKTIRYAYNLITMITIPLAIGSLLYGKTIILLLSGEEYLKAVDGMKILFFSMFFATLGNLLSSGGLILARKEKVTLFATASGAIINIILNLIMIPNFGCTGASVTTLITEIIIFGILFFKFNTIINVNLGIYHIIKCLIASCVFIPIRFLCFFIKANIWIEASSIVICAIFYFIILCIIKDELAISALNSMKNKIFK